MDFVINDVLGAIEESGTERKSVCSQDKDCIDC
ncbi:hypothetical protein AYI68_g7429, partial [Smittium mucronatum]